jgi:hypothetical protein
LLDFSNDFIITILVPEVDGDSLRLALLLPGALAPSPTPFGRLTLTKRFGAVLDRSQPGALRLISIFPKSLIKALTIPTPGCIGLKSDMLEAPPKLMGVYREES